MRRAGAVAAILVAIGLSLAGCAEGGEASGRATGTSGASATAGAAVTTTLARTLTGAVDLRRLVITTAPAGYGLQPSPPYGAVDLERVLGQFSDAPDDDRVILDRARFRRGYTRGWRRADPPSFLGVFVFEFAGADGAHAARDAFAAQNEVRQHASRFEVDGIADAVGESYTRQVEGGLAERVQVVTFVRGARLYQVSGQFPDESASVEATVVFAQTENQVAA